MDVPVLSQVLEALKRIGKSTDAAGTTTLNARLAQIAGFNPANYPNRIAIDGIAVASSATAGAWTTIWSASGKGGFIDRALVSNNVAANTYGLRITVDGVKVFDGTILDGNPNSVGVVQENEVILAAATLLATSSGAGGLFARIANGVYRFGKTLRQFPYTGGGAGACILYAPIPFNNSVLVEANCSAASAAMDYSIGGGLQ